MDFGPIEYVVERIDGDYAYIQQIDKPQEESKSEARALLPSEITEGTKHHYEMLQ